MLSSSVHRRSAQCYRPKVRPQGRWRTVDKLDGDTSPQANAAVGGIGENTNNTGGDAFFGAASGTPAVQSCADDGDGAREDRRRPDGSDAQHAYGWRQRQRWSHYKRQNTEQRMLRELRTLESLFELTLPQCERIDYLRRRFATSIRHGADGDDDDGDAAAAKNGPFVTDYDWLPLPKTDPAAPAHEKKVSHHKRRYMQRQRQRMLDVRLCATPEASMAIAQQQQQKQKQKQKQKHPWGFMLEDGDE